MVSEVKSNATHIYLSEETEANDQISSRICWRQQTEEKEHQQFLNVCGVGASKSFQQNKCTKVCTCKHNAEGRVRWK